MFTDSKQLSEAFLENHALFHKSCVSAYNKQKLNRKRKHFEAFGATDDEPQQTLSESDGAGIRSTEVIQTCKILLRLAFFVEKETLKKNFIVVKHSLSIKK